MAASKKRAPFKGVAHVKSGFNNTILTITSISGDTVAWASGGMDQKGARKATGHAAEEASKDLAKRVVEMGMGEVDIRLSGPGAGRDSSVRGLASGGLRICAITEETPIPHNGCTRRKRKRN